MKKKFLLSFFSLLSFLGYSQLALEGFEGTFPPTDWAVFDVGVGGSVNWATNPNSCQDLTAAYMNRQNIAAGVTSEEYLATKSFLVPTNGELRFFSRTFTAGNQGTLYQVKIADATSPQNVPGSYTTLIQYTEDELSAVFNVCDEKVIDLTAYAGTNVYIAFVMVYTQPTSALSGDRWLLDNVQVIEKCLDPTNLGANPLATSATLNWTGAGASFEIENLLAADTPTGVATATSTTTSFNQTGLTPNTNYCYYVKAVCADSSSEWAGPFCYTTTTLPPVCGGNYVDSGGTTANYPNSANDTVTICPDVPGEVVTVSFTSFNTEAFWDGIYVYNGSVAGANQIASTNPVGNGPLTTPGAFWGNTIPGPFTSSAPDGCLTFTFLSDAFFNNPGWIANVTCGPPPTCPNPNGLTVTGVTSTAGLATWTSNSTATTFNILALPCGSPAPDSSTTGYLTVNTNTNAPITGLDPDTCYDIYVRDECGPADFSIWIGVTNILTQPVPPACGGTFTDPGGSNGNYVSNTDYTVTICPDVPGDVVTVTFTEFDTETNWDGLYVFNGNVSGANQISSGNPANNVPGGVPGAFWGNTIPGPFTSSTPDGCLTFRFRSDGSVNFSGWIANVTCGPPPTCPTPNSLTASNITSNTVTLNWTSNSSATTFNMIALPCGSPAPDGTTTGYQTSATNINALLSGLDPDTCYDIYVRDECAPDDFSLWIGPSTITTQIAPPACGGLFTDLGGSTGNYTSNTDYIVTICPDVPGEIVTVTFTEFDTETNWDGLYVFDGNSIGAPQIASNNPANNVPGGVPGSFWGNTIPGPFSSSSADGCLTFRFRSDGSVNFSGWIANVTCGPPPTCRKPNDLASSGITLDTATFNWNQLQNPDGSTASAWQVLILPAGSPAPDATTTGWIDATSTTFNATGLTQATCYDYYVRAVCSSSDSSLWAGPSSFCTLIPNDDCDGAIDVLTNPDQSCTNFANGSLIGSTPSSQANNCAGQAVADVWFEFVATSANHSINLNNIVGDQFDLGFAVYSGDCAVPTEIFCDGFGTDGVLNGLTVGQTYYIRVFTNPFANNQNITFEVCVGTIPPPITTNDTQYTNVQLVEDVLFNSTCATVTNVTTSTGSNFGSVNGIGYFNRNGSTFPFEDGVILTSGSIESAVGPNTTQSSDGNQAWTGDADLEAIILAATGNPMNSRNASILEFDFIPLIDTISFDFLFASEEYGTFQCTFSDAFAFLLTNNSTGVTTNLAVVPNTTTPISVVTIRDDEFNNGCASVNEEYFGDFYQLPLGLNPLGSPANFNGTTVPMTASATVIPGQQYHIKLVVADRQDNILDSAVFLEGGSFNFGLELGIDFLISGGNALCAGTTNQLTSDLDPALYSFVWSDQNGVIPGETGPNLLINQTGTYTLVATLNNTSCSATDSIIVEYYDPIVLSTPNNLTACNSTGFAEFTLSNNNASVLGTYPAAQHTVTYHLTQADATAGINPLPNLYTNVIAFTQTIYARVTNVAGCFGTSQFDLVVQDLTPQFTLTPETTICSGSSGILTVTPGNFNVNDVTYTWTFNGDPFGGNTSSITVSQAGTYGVTVNNSGCTASATTSVIVNVCEISIYASAVWMQDCTTENDGKFFNTSGSGQDLINQDGSTFAINYGVHVQNSNTLIMRGAELKTQKTASSNVCDATMNYRVFPTGNTPGAFNEWPLPFYSDCNTGTGTFDVGGGPCTTGQQKWQCVSQAGCTPPLDLTTLAPGNYTIQVFYDINGSFNTPNGCTDNLVLDNGGNYYVANFTIQAPATITSTDPTSCNGSDGSITISNLVPNQFYEVSYTDDTVLVGPVNLTSNANGEIVISNLNAGVYTDFNFNVNSCNTVLSSSATLINPGAPVVSVNSPVICNGETTTVTATPAVPGNYTYVWTVPAGFPNPGNVASFTTSVPGDYSVVITTSNGVNACNLDFESPTVTGQFPTLLNQSTVSCWQTSASDGILEFWPSPNYESVPAYSGTQFIEMNANFTSTISQNVTVEPGSTLNIQFAHRGRQGNDTVGVEVGPVGGPYTNLGQFTDGNTAWTLHNVSYLVPNNAGNNYSIRFVSVSSAGGNPSVGNYLDAVSVSSVACSSELVTGTVSLLPSVTLSLTSGSAEQNVCINTPIETIVYTSVNATDVSATGLPNGVTGTFNAGEFTISGTPTESGTFNYTVTTVGGCNVVTAVGSIIVNPDSTLTLTSGNDAQTVCINNAITDITYSATDATDVTVTDLPSGVTATYADGVLTISGTPTESGVFTYTATTVGNCANVILTGTITVNPDVTLTLMSANENQNVCINTAIVAITYLATDATDVTVSGLPNGVAGAYNAGTFTISGTPTETGTFNYTVSTVSACGSASLTGTIIVNPNVTLVLSTGDDTQTLCVDTAITTIVYQSANGATGISVTGLPAGVTGTLAGDLLTISGTPTVTGTFNYTVTTIGGCSSASLSGTIVVNALTTPTFGFGTSITLCPGSTPPSLPTSSSTGITGTWSPSTISTSVSDVYTFTPDANQCATPTTLTVTLESAFSFAIDGACQGNAFILEPFATENSFDENTSSYNWVYNGNTVGTDFDFNATEYLSNNTSVTLPMVVTLTITTSEGCSNTATYTVTRVFCDIQNGISPNNDGKNEFFDLRLLNVRNLNIFNRYGTIVYSKGNYTNEWKGQSDKGEELPDGTYYYVIEFNDNQAAKTGWIYINRQN